MTDDIQTLLEQTLHLNVLSIERYPKGLTNQNWLCHCIQGDFMVRWPHEDAHQIVHREHEAKAMELIHTLGLDVDTLYYDVQTGIKVTRFVADLKTFDEYEGDDKIERTAVLMKRLHRLNKTIGHTFDPIARYHQYASHVKTLPIDPMIAQQVIQTLEHFTPRLTLCHNDWVPGNIGFSPTRDYLIDYEYAGDNDPFFDVMSFITENDLSDAQKANFMLTYFEGSWTDEEKKRLYAYGDFHNLLWATWAQMMVESRHELVYQEIRDLKVQALLNGLIEKR